MRDKKVVILLSGCGAFDGSEVLEVSMTLLALARNNFEWFIVAPNKIQPYVINHLDGNVKEHEKRNMLEEAARIARGNISEIERGKYYSANALIIPGGFGNIRNLCNWQEEKENTEVLPEVKDLIIKFYRSGKYIVSECLANILLAVSLKGIFKRRLKIASPDDRNFQNYLVNLGCEPVICSGKDFVIDLDNKVISTPAFLATDNIYEVYQAIEEIVKRLRELT